MDEVKLVERSQEQALGAWVDYIVRLRISALIEALETLNLRVTQSLDLLDQCKKDVYEFVIDNGMGRGGPHGMKGFIAERVDVAIENARSAIDGAEPVYSLVDDNGPIDIMRGFTPIQQKFTLAHFSVDSIVEHLDTYPGFVDEGGIYRIPKDNFEELLKIRSLALSNPDRMRIGQRTTWERLQELERRGVTLDSNIEPASISFKQSFRDNFENALDNEGARIKEVDSKRRLEAEETGRPTAKEAGAAVAVGAALEGGTALALGIHKKLRSGKQFREFDSSDWQELGLETATGTVKGGVRGAVVYAATNYTPIPGAAATAAVTATYGVIGQARQLQAGKITKDEFLVNSEALCSEVAVSAVSSMVGTVAIPVPVLGALVGNAVGTIMYGIASRHLTEFEIGLIRDIQCDISETIEILESETQDVSSTLLGAASAGYDELLVVALGNDGEKALVATAELAQMAGADPHRIVRSRADLDALFG